ncbi:hypothetical protein C8R46DRAFT_1362322 [Mycena filopes]|nr:hypothetical protein C8R46DRAFT_1362322 [Mycena filopes]
MSDSQPSHFFVYFPLVIDSLTYGVYAALFSQSIHILLTHRPRHHKLHLACMITLFALSTLHVALAWAWAFLTDHGATAIYELFSLEDPLPTLYFAGDPRGVRALGVLLKARYSLANAIADGIIVSLPIDCEKLIDLTDEGQIYRCYVIWGFDWRPVAFPLFAYACTLAGGIMSLLPLSGTTERASFALCVATVFFTNTLSAALAAGRIWWISRRASAYLGRRSRQRYLALTAILLESGLIYPAALIITIVVYLTPSTPTNSVLVCIAACYHIVGIAPTLIIVRVGLGVSTDDVDKCVVTISRNATSTPYPPHERRRADATLELQVRVTREQDVDVDDDEPREDSFGDGDGKVAV